MEFLPEKLKNLPASPGVYLFQDAKGDVLYVGKAKLLRSRVRSYFQSGAQLEPAKKQMIKKIADIETIATDTETEALVLEANLIRKHQPPYNVVLRDDKYYLFIKITTSEELPRVFITRRLRNDKARYFGPYSSAKSVRATLKLLRRIFPFRGEKESPRDIIFPHPLFTQANAANEAISYKLNIENIIRFLTGNREEIMQALREGMKTASQEKQYERAAIFRDQLQALERLEGSQKVYLPRNETFDVVSIVRSKTMSAANIFQVRSGKLLGKQTFLLNHRMSASPQDTLRQFLLQYYDVAQDIPNTILVPYELEDAPAIGQWIREEASPVLAVPRRGKKRQLLTMGETNAQLLLDEQAAAFQKEERAQKAEAELLAAIGIQPHSAPPAGGAPRGNPPRRIETYDISNIQGSLATASMVVFVGGEAQPKEYRKFRIQAENTPNDFAMIQETLRRRFSGRHLVPPSLKLRRAQWPMPDLIIIDGGKGQLSAAQKVLQELNVTVPVISIAKREEEIFIPGTPQSLRLPYNSDALYLIQRMRDEAHRFTVTYHRLLRSKEQRRSILDEVPGIGPKTKKTLLRRFGSLKAIRKAEEADIAAVIGPEKAKKLREYL